MRFVMTNSNSLSIPAVMLLGLTLSVTARTPSSCVPLATYCKVEESQTTSRNQVALEYTVESPRTQALNLYGVQTDFSSEERKTYRNVLREKSIETGINLFDFL